MPSGELKAALDEATRLFATSGIAVCWRDCSGDVAACDLAVSQGAFAIGIRPDDPREKTAFALGFSMLSIGKGNRAVVVYQRVRDFARLRSARVDTVLAFAVAHELAHLFTGSAEHAESGLMRSVWSKEDARRMEQRNLGFDAAHATAIRRQLAAGQPGVAGGAR